MRSPDTQAAMDRYLAKFEGMSDLEKLQATESRRMEIAEQLVADNPHLPQISALVIGGDMASAERSEEWVRDGAVAEEVVDFVGSYARLDFAVKMLEAGYLSEDYVLSNLPELWRGSDPDDTDPRFLALWMKARERNHGKYVRDGAALPRGPLTVYRGQIAEGNLGIAWSLDRDIAEKFARTGGLRARVGGGNLYRVTIDRSEVLAYLTGRDESEVIFDPAYLEGTWAKS